MGVSGCLVLIYDGLLVVGAGSTGVFSHDLEVVSYCFDEFLAASIHEPNLVCDFSGQGVVKRTTLSVPVVGAKHRLLELLMVSECKRQIKRLELGLASRVDQD